MMTVNNKLQVTTLTMPGGGGLSQKRLRPRECLLDCKDKKHFPIFQISKVCFKRPDCFILQPKCFTLKHAQSKMRRLNTRKEL